MATFDSDSETTALLRTTDTYPTPIQNTTPSSANYGSRLRNNASMSEAKIPVDPEAITIESSDHPAINRYLSETGLTQPITLSWENLNVHVKAQGKKCCKSLGKEDVNSSGPKQILKNVSGIVKPGTLLAILGASGAGKSTLLNVLNHRNTEGLNIEGDIFVNGSKISPTTFTAMSAYVQQDDIFIGLLKVKEHLWFQSKLRMEKNVPEHIREQRVEQVIADLGLTKCQDTIIGTHGVKKSISGGERKRLAFASEIMTNPSLLFCDEPTSGLDSFMAENVIMTLKSLAAQGKTIICTIHQPSSEVFALFDSLLIMAEGRVAYMGPAADAVPFFTSAGYRCPESHNPADYFIHRLALIPGKEEECTERVKTVCDSFEKSSQSQDIHNDMEAIAAKADSGLQIEIPQSRYKRPWCEQFSAVLWRSWVTTIREPMATKLRIVQALITGLLFGLIYLQQDYNQKGVMNINGVLFLLEVQVSFGNVFAVITTFPVEFPIYVREYQNGMYRPDVYYLSKIFAEFPIYMMVPLLFASISYWMIGFYPEWEQFLICAGVLVLVTNVATSYGYVVGCATSSVNLAVAILPSVIIPMMLFGGFFLNSGTVPVYFIWLQYISWFNYCNEILIVNQWKNVKNITCEYITPNMTGAVEQTSRCFSNGLQVIESLSFDVDNIYNDIYCLFALMVGFRILSFIILMIRSRRVM